MFSSLYSTLAQFETAIVIFGLAHFLIAYIYGYKATTKKPLYAATFVVLMSVASLLLISSVPTRFFLLAAGVLFAIHHADDSFRIYGSKYVSVFWFLYGVLSSALILAAFFFHRMSETLPVVLFFGVTMYHIHYVVHILLEEDISPTKKKIFMDDSILPFFLDCSFFLSKDDALLFSFRFFYLQTIAHIVFTYSRRSPSFMMFRNLI
jgi:hypothetical protein